MNDNLLQHQVEVSSMVGKLVEIFVDHTESTLENSVEYLRDLRSDECLNERERGEGKG